jgi:anti-anti-sigma factor
MDGNFATRFVESDGDAVLIVTGEIDASSSQKLLDACVAMTSISSGLVLDLSRVPFMDSSGLHVLIRMNHCDKITSVVVRNPSQQVRRLLEITRLAPEFLEAPTQVTT